ncbi:hypothetical protein [Deminuibacter soli]|uniref:DUF4136 domain-containing protein n=1 Tax=Deminuibacter soli TaxID=2291815 RepID=A0A3E1NPE8_9BACT|nr:hypothetical protein [Deminuibacter soli]RFM29704.1 hypothetical protein DXN05_01620 [Deminuibacter soli]
MKRIIPFAGAALAVVLLLQSCSSSTKLTNSWAAQESGTNHNTPKIKKVMVLAMFNNASNMSLRTNMEKELVRDLKAYRVDAVGALQTYGPKAFDGLTENQALAKLRESGSDAVLTVRLLDKNKEKQYVPGRYAPYPYGFWGYYSYYSPMMYQPGYYANSVQYSFESNLYGLNDSQLIYSAQSSALDPSSPQGLADDYARMIVKDLHRKGAIGR